MANPLAAKPFHFSAAEDFSAGLPVHSLDLNLSRQVQVQAEA